MHTHALSALNPANAHHAQRGTRQAIGEVGETRDAAYGFNQRRFHGDCASLQRTTGTRCACAARVGVCACVFVGACTLFVAESTGKQQLAHQVCVDALNVLGQLCLQDGRRHLLTRHCTHQACAGGARGKAKHARERQHNGACPDEAPCSALSAGRQKGKLYTHRGHQASVRAGQGRGVVGQAQSSTLLRCCYAGWHAGTIRREPGCCGKWEARLLRGCGAGWQPLPTTPQCHGCAQHRHTHIAAFADLSTHCLVCRWLAWLQESTK